MMPIRLTVHSVAFDGVQKPRQLGGNFRKPLPLHRLHLRGSSIEATSLAHHFGERVSLFFSIVAGEPSQLQCFVIWI